VNDVPIDWQKGPLLRAVVKNETEAQSSEQTHPSIAADSILRTTTLSFALKIYDQFARVKTELASLGRHAPDRSK
jgi:hypothetical protein